MTLVGIVFVHGKKAKDGITASVATGLSKEVVDWIKKETAGDDNTESQDSSCAKQCNCGKLAQKKTSIHNRVQGGAVAKQHEFPWMASLKLYTDKKLIFFNWNHAWAGGILLTNFHVLTAAHNVKAVDEDPDRVVVMLGHNKVEDRFHNRAVVDLTVHPEYNKEFG